MNILVRKETQTKWTFHGKDIFSLQISITRVVKAKKKKNIEIFFFSKIGPIVPVKKVLLPWKPYI